MIKHVPNTITTLNLLSGIFSIFFSIVGNPTLAAYMIFMAAVFDFLDGFAARTLNAYSELGKQLDSLADLVSFGLAPSVILFSQMAHILEISLSWEEIQELSISKILLLVSPALIVIASAIRLAKFNIDEKQTDHFIGLPTPASGLLFASLPLIMQSESLAFLTDLLNSSLTLFLLIISISFLMVSTIPMFSLKIKNLKDPANIPAYLLILISLVLLILFYLKAVFAIIILYIFMALINSIFLNKP
jgi:CDP-diacylglycerol--serine O-phosphatidyltransferase